MHHLTLAATEEKSLLLKLEGQMKILWGVKEKKREKIEEWQLVRQDNKK